MFEAVVNFMREALPAGTLLPPEASSLGYLRDFPINLLKVDKSFIDSIALDPEDSALARAVIKLGRALGLKVVAEGVEDKAQASALQHLNCEYAQGYLFSKPVPPHVIEGLLKQRLFDVPKHPVLT